MEQNPHVAAFVNDVGSIFRMEDPETFWKCEARFRALLATPFVSEVLMGALQGLRAATYRANWLAKELVVHRGRGIALSISTFETQQRYIHSHPYHAMFAPLGERGLTCNVYRLPEEYRNDVFDPRIKLSPDQARSVSRNEVMRLESGLFAYDFRIENPTPVVKFMTTAIYPLEWLFTRDDLRAWQANDADLTFTQLRVATDVLGQFAHQSSISPLRTLTYHMHHAVRWAAIQNLGRLSRSEAIVRLREAVNDLHPHIRRAAQKTLQKLDPK